MVTFDPEDDSVLYLSNKGKLMTFELDKVFPLHASQEEVGHQVPRRHLHSIFLFFVLRAATLKPSLIRQTGVPGGPVLGDFLYRWL